MENAVEITDLSKCFKVYKKQYHRLAEMVTGRRKHEEYWALRNVNLTVKKGEALGIVGANGAGKSTLLKLICGALYGTGGTVLVHGRVLSLLELGTGFHPELTGIDNIFNSASMQGFERKEIEEKLEDIIEFADIGEYIHVPVKTYSSGMYVRLAFALYACLEPDIYIVDEALSVGDVFFQQKCYERMRQMKEQGVTIIMVSHDPAPVVSFCDRAVLIQKGRIAGEGKPDIILDMYQALQYSRGMKTDCEITVKEHVEFGTKEAELIGCALSDETGAEKTVWGIRETCRLKAVYASAAIADAVSIGFQIKNAFGNIVFGTNSNWLGESLLFTEGRLECSFEFPIYLGEGSYTVTLAVVENKYQPALVYAWTEKALAFEVVKAGSDRFGGSVYLPVRMRKQKDEKMSAKAKER